MFNHYVLRFSATGHNSVFHFNRSVAKYNVLRQFFLFLHRVWFSLLGFRLNIATIAFEFHKLSTNPTLFQSALMFLGCLTTLSDDFLAFRPLHQTLAEESCITSRSFVMIITLLAPEISMTIVTAHPGHKGVLGKNLQNLQSFGHR